MDYLLSPKMLAILTDIGFLFYSVIGTTVICGLLLLGPFMAAGIIIYIYHLGEKSYERIRNWWEERYSR